VNHPKRNNDGRTFNGQKEDIVIDFVHEKTLSMVWRYAFRNHGDVIYTFLEGDDEAGTARAIMLNAK